MSNSDAFLRIFVRYARMGQSHARAVGPYVNQAGWLRFFFDLLFLVLFS
jgi:hypothetical protein